MQVKDLLVYRRRFVIPFLGSSLLLAAVAGCHRAPSPDVMATVNGKEITRAELDRAYKNYMASVGEGPQAPSPEQAAITRLNLLRGLIEDEMVQQRAAKLNLVATDDDVNAKLTEMKAPYTQEEWDRQLKQQGITLNDLKRDISRSLTQEKLMNKEIESKINITDADISNYYAAHKAEFDLIEPRYHLAQIVASAVPIQQPGNMPARPASDAEAKKKIQALYGRLKSGEDFGNLAIQFSDNATNSSSGGDMGFIFESALRSDPDAFNAISKLKQGEITDPLPVYDPSGPGHKIIGYAIYKLIGREPAGQRELNDPRVQQAIRQYLRDSHAQLLRNAYLEILRDQAKVRNYYAEQIMRNGAQ